MNTVTTPTVAAQDVRRHFSALSSSTIFLENAGGSQVPDVVSDAIRDYMRTSYVQLGAGYAEANRADAVVAEAHAFVETFMNATETGRVILGPSSSQLCMMLAQCYETVLAPGDEIVIATASHEANVTPWIRLQERGVKIRWWPVDLDDTSPLAALEPLLNERTKLVAVVQVSNLLGGIVDVGAITRLVHDAGARVVVDGVAYAPHRAIDVQAWDVDWYVYSTYKVYGPHMAALYGRHDALAELCGPNHFFIPQNAVPYKFELGGASHEGCAGLLALRGYLSFLAGAAADAPFDYDIVRAAFENAAAFELPLQARLLAFLDRHPDVQIIGPRSGGADRVGTISFTHARLSSREIASRAHAANIGIRHGHMYAHRLCSDLGIDLVDGVVRVSLVHYNTMGEIDRLIDVFSSW